MELCGPNMSESGGSLCQVKQLPCHSVPLTDLQATGHNVHNLLHLTHQRRVKRPALAVASSPSSAPRRRINGTAACGSPERGASTPGQEAAPARRVSKGKVVVTGGGGYFGFRLGRGLSSEGLSVILLDISQPSCDVPDGAIFYQSDILDYPSLYKVCEGVDCIFHTASYGMSGPEQNLGFGFSEGNMSVLIGLPRPQFRSRSTSLSVFDVVEGVRHCQDGGNHAAHTELQNLSAWNPLRKEKVESVNVEGTSNVIKVCKERSIPRLVYTSTINVVFAGKPIEDGDEASVPYVPCDGHIDHYSRTKAIAEQMVLSANGCSLKDGGLLRTCVLRPCGIYGPEEKRHLHRVMVNVERRLFSFRFGDPRARMNWVHVDNLVLAHTLAAEALTPKRTHVASGQTYFINDGVSVNLFEWLTPLFEKLGYSRPLINLPVSLVYSAAILMEYLHVALRPVIEVPLLFTRSEVRNIAVGHTFKIDKARRELGYCPKPYSLADSVEQYLKSRQPRSSSPRSGLSWSSQLHRHPALLLLLMGLGLVLLMLSCTLSLN